MIETYIGGVFIVLRSNYLMHVAHGRHAGQIVKLVPVFTAISCVPKQAIIGAHPQQVFVQSAFGNAGGLAKYVGTAVFSNGIHAPYTAHHFQAVTVGAAAQVGAYYGPAITPVVGAEYFIGPKIQTGRLLAADGERRIPVPPPGWFAFGFNGFYG